tara:strand:+ start:215 stop:577 length:363 start_codon:yes stop_codon:yes gene_type:complete
MSFKMKGWGGYQNSPLNKKEKFKPHNMYDKKKAETHKEHLELKEKGYSHTPMKLKKDIKMYEGNGKQIKLDDSDLGKEYFDEHGNKARDHKKTKDVFYTKPPRFEGPREPLNPEPKRLLA